MTKKIIGGAVGLGILLGLSVFVFLMTNNKISFGYNDGYQPDQPIPYSHALHAGKLQIDCKYCHTTAADGRHASVPALNICMNCHMVVRPDSEWIQKISEAYNNGTPIQWQKVNLLPDHVKFSHAPHIKAGKDCQTCHGPIQEMETVYQKETLSMGWCVNCHRQPENNAPTHCGTCHY